MCLPAKRSVGGGGGVASRKRGNTQQTPGDDARPEKGGKGCSTELGLELGRGLCRGGQDGGGATKEREQNVVLRACR